jgi:cytochrome c-type biogenesis protein CcmH/NrfG
MRLCVVALLLLPLAAWSLESASPAAAAAKRDFERCRAYANLDACYDGIRRNPGDPALNVALGDALVRANRPADAIRAYRRAAAITPNMPGVAAKISATEAKLTPVRPPAKPPVRREAPGKRYSNAASETQSH